jgi:4-hydroxy-3-polyprenylbenzoate decarboxylase
MVVIVGITGASGVVYGIRLLEVLSSIKDVETHVIITSAGESIIKHETDWQIDDVRSMANFSYRNDEIGARLASGSFRRDAMIVAPCSIKTMSALANSYAEGLLARAGDVTLKEHRKLVLAVRETPFHIGHLRLMERLTEMGAIVMPPIPGFYNRPRSIQDIVDHTVGKMLDILDIKHNLFERWAGLSDVIEPNPDE